MATNATGESDSGPLRLQFDCSVKLAFRGSSISSDGGLLLHRELDDALGLMDMAAESIADPRIGKNGRHRLAGFLRQSVFSRLAEHEDVNDADRLARDPVMRQLIGGRAVKNGAASASAMGRFETEMLTRPENLAALTDLPGRWIDAAHERRNGDQYSAIGIAPSSSQSTLSNGPNCRWKDLRGLSLSYAALPAAPQQQAEASEFLSESGITF